MPATSAPTWAVAAAAGQAPSIVRLRNLQSTARIGLDAWSRTSRPQPLLVSASVSLVQSSASSSASDSVAADTVHYGLLSKAILSTLNGVEGGIAAGAQTPVSLRNLLDLLWETLTGKLVNGTPAKATSAPFLDLRSVRCLSLKLQLPKASLVGGCVSLTGTSVYNDGEAQLYGVCLGLSNLRVPTLIGVNSNEREAKQVVIADVEIDECCEEGDIYPHLENVIYEVRSMHKLALSRFQPVPAFRDAC